MNLYPPFVAALNRMREKYGERFERYNALHNDNLNFTEFINNFVDSESVADVSPDANANSSSHDVRTMLADMTKPHTKLLGFNKIFYEMTKAYGLATAEEWLEAEWNGCLYGHDFATTTLYSYCWAMTLRPVVDKGLYFINHFRAQPAKHFDSFNEHVRETICWMANRQSGAVGVPDYLIYAWWYWQNDVKSGYTKDPERYRDQQFQSFIYSLNQPFMRISECAFTNVSIFDREYLMGLFGGTVFPDGTLAVDHVDELIEFEKAFMTVIKHTRREMMFTFPVLTYALLYQEHHFVDEEFARWAVEFNREFCDANFFVGNDVTVLSNCCFDGDTTVHVNGRYGKDILPFHTVYDQYANVPEGVKVYGADGEWRHAKVVRLPGRPMYRVELHDGRNMTVTDNHLHPVWREGHEVIPTRNLKPGDLLWVIKTGDRDFVSPDGDCYARVESVTLLDSVPEFVYCFEMEDQTMPYFTLPNGIITHNCRLLSDTTKLKGFINSIGGTSLEIGSIKVNTINLHRIAIEAEGDEEKYMQILRERTVLCIKFLDVVRHILKRNVEKGLLPNYTYHLIDFDKQYSTIGVLGVYEAVNDFGLIRVDETGNHFYTDEGIAFAERILATVNEVKDAWKSDCSYNIESVPAERAAVVLANKDNELYPDLKNKYFILSNQWIPLMEKCTIHEKIRVGSYLDKACNGGVIAHINLEGDFASFEQAWDTINYIADQGVLYFAFNRAISVCEHEHSFYGETCPKCGGKKKDTYCRVVGFLTPVSSYSKERRQEFDLRKWFKIGNDMF